MLLSMSEFSELLDAINKHLSRLDELAKGNKAKEMIALGRKIRLYRSKRNMSQEELAKKLFVTKMAIIKWEMGRAKPSESNMQRLEKLGIK